MAFILYCSMLFRAYAPLIGGICLSEECSEYGISQVDGRWLLREEAIRAMPDGV